MPSEWLPIHKGDQTQTETGKRFGGKYEGLASLARKPEFNVPAGVGLSIDVAELIKSSPRAIGDLLEREVVPHLRLERDRVTGQSDFTRLAIRSSANVEDGTHSGFPGVFETVTNVRLITEDMLEAILSVVNSAHTDQVKAFAESQGISHDLIKMGCVIQWQVESVLSGVAMTSSTDSVRDQFVLLNFAEGPCANVVDGKSANEIVFTKDGAIPVSANCKDFDGLFWDARADYKSFSSRPLQRKWQMDTLMRVCRVCIEVENLSGRPMDVEWCVDDQETVFLLQARPIIHRQAIALMSGM